jgi:hypothetical protein
MRWFACLMAVCAFTFGCNQPTETIPSVAPASSGTTVDEHAGHDHGEEGEHAEEGDDAEAQDLAPPAPTVDPSASNGKTETIRFVADKKISVPGMSCPYSCWPKVQETLAAQPGVEGVQLAEQPADAAEGEIVERVVELKLNDQFDLDAAIAALAKVSFKAEAAN